MVFGGNRTECALLLMLREWDTNYQELREAHSSRVLMSVGFSSERKMSSVLMSAEKPGEPPRLYSKGAPEAVLPLCTHVYGPDGLPQALTDTVAGELYEVVNDMAKRGLRVIALSQADLPRAGSNDSDLDQLDSISQLGNRVRQLLDRPTSAGESGIMSAVRASIACASSAGSSRRMSVNTDVSAAIIEGEEGAEGEGQEPGMALLALVAIEDPVRPEVPDSVAACQAAGIIVRMVTGDHLQTAKHIARSCGILTDEGFALEAPTFRQMAEAEIMEVLPRLQVLARSTPHDKYTLVRLLQASGQVVAATGDGINDVSALKEADVGLAMGIAGTEVAKDAADIVILDDNFNSIARSVLWGRNTSTNVRKFLQFQLTVNVVAMTIALVAAVTTGITPLSVLQLLWVNLIMDSMGALALATEEPSVDLLQQRPYRQNEALISKTMWKHILVQAVYQLFWLLLVFYGAPMHLNGYAPPVKCAYFWDGYLNGLEESLPATGGNLCCGQETSCLVADGGIYLPGEAPLCTLKHVDPGCGLLIPTVAAVCGPGSWPDNGCPRYELLSGWWQSAMDAYKIAKEAQQMKTNTLMFNTFIICQVFNMVASRKVGDELNVLEGAAKSKMFWIMLALMCGGQVLIIMALGEWFKVAPQSGLEWLFALGVGSGTLLVNLAAKLLPRSLPRWRRGRGSGRGSDGGRASGHGPRRSSGDSRKSLLMMTQPRKVNSRTGSLLLNSPGGRSAGGGGGGGSALSLLELPEHEAVNCGSGTGSGSSAGGGAGGGSNHRIFAARLPAALTGQRHRGQRVHQAADTRGRGGGGEADDISHLL